MKTIIGHNSVVIDFAEARKRVEALAEHSIEIAASAIPIELEFVPQATMLERLYVTLTDEQLADLIHTTLEESK